MTLDNIPDLGPDPCAVKMVIGRRTPRPKRKQHRGGASAPRKTPQATRNRRAGRRFELDLAKRIGARAGQALTGDVDLDGGHFIAEAKLWSSIGARWQALVEQMDKRERRGREVWGFVGWRRPGKPTRIFVLCDLGQWEGLYGQGAYGETGR